MQNEAEKKRIVSFVSCPDEVEITKKSYQKRNVSSRYKLDPERKKLPRPIVFWSLGEKDAFRRNRAIQVELNKDLAHISWQNNLSGRKIRYEARQFRDRIKNFWPDPSVVIFGSGYPIIEQPKDKGGKKQKDNYRSKSATCLRFTGQIVKSAHSVANPSSHDDASVADSVENADGYNVHLKRLPSFKADRLIRSRAKSETDLTEIRDMYQTSGDNISSEGLAKVRDPKRPCFNRMDSFLFDRIKEAYHLKLDLRNSARERLLNPSKKQRKRQDILEGEKAKYALHREKVQTYLSKLDLYLACETSE